MLKYRTSCTCRIEVTHFHFDAPHRPTLNQKLLKTGRWWQTCTSSSFRIKSQRFHCCDAFPFLVTGRTVGLPAVEGCEPVGRLSQGKGNSAALLRRNQKEKTGNGGITITNHPINYPWFTIPSTCTSNSKPILRGGLLL